VHQRNLKGAGRHTDASVSSVFETEPSSSPSDICGLQYMKLGVQLLDQAAVSIDFVARQLKEWCGL